MKEDHTDTTLVAGGVAIGFALGIIAGAAFISRGTNILKSAQWTPQGDMILMFWNRYNGILIPKPE